MTIAARRQPGGWAMTVEQFRVTGLLQRPHMALLTGSMLAIGIALVLATAGAVRGDAGGPHAAAELIFLLAAQGPLLLLAALWPLITWRKDPPSQRGPYWAAPIARGKHTLKRLAVSWVWLMAMAAIYLAVLTLVAIVHAIVEPEVGALLSQTGSALLGATIIYLVFSVPPIIAERPAILIGEIGLSWGFLIVLENMAGISVFSDLSAALIRHARDGTLLGVENPAAVAIWGALGLFGCIAAAVIHQEGGL